MRYIVVAILLFVGVVESIRHRKLTRAGAFIGGLLGFLIFIGGGWTGLALLILFFLLGTGATSWKRRQKAVTGMAQEQHGQRHAGQVLANGGVAGLVGLLSLFLPIPFDLAVAIMAGAFSAAMADTLSSELGTVYGKRFFNILTFRNDQKGLDGVISIEGTLIGFIGSVLVAVVYSIGLGWNERFFWVVIAGTAGNIFDSILGAWLERKGRIGNDLVNLLNTTLGAAVILLFWWLA